MKNRVPALVLAVVMFYSCKPAETWDATIVNKETGTVKIAFGSCAHSYDTLEIFDAINEQKPDLWVWLGDIVYGDTQDMKILKEKYDRQKAKPQYQQLLNNTPVIGVWDDHDYGTNDGGKHYTMKDESKDLLLDFLDITKNNPVRNHQGVYSSYNISLGDNNIKVLLMDTRYFRDTLQADTLSTARYLPNPNGDVLGENQWQWLKTELSDKETDLFILGASIQLIAEEQGYEKWANFPAARTRLFELLKTTGSTPVFVISGDRHMAELSKIDIPGLDYPLYDLTASGLTHTWGMYWPEPNKYRVDSLIVSKNFGLVNVDFKNDQPILNIEVINETGQKLMAKTIVY